MKQETTFVIQPEEQRALGRGKALSFALGEQRIHLRFEMPSANGAAPSAPAPSRNVCPGCKRNLADAKWGGKHARACRILRAAASKKRSGS